MGRSGPESKFAAKYVQFTGVFYIVSESRSFYIIGNVIFADSTLFGAKCKQYVNSSYC